VVFVLDTDAAGVGIHTVNCGEGKRDICNWKSGCEKKQ
jgi:hypothetical protein